MRVAISTIILALFFNSAQAQFLCDIAQQGLEIRNAGNTANISTICVGEHANFRFTIYNNGSSGGCTIPAGTVTVNLSFPTISGGAKPFIYAGPASFSSGIFTWTYNAGAEILQGVNTAPIPQFAGDADVLVDVIGNAPGGSGSAILNIIQNGGVSNNPINDNTSAQLNVSPVPSVTCPASFATCINAAPIPLSGGSPSGGVYSGPGVSGGIFTPATAGAGTHTISYTITGAGGCPSTCTFTITVNPLPAVTCPASFAVCSNLAPFALTGGLPAGGTYSGTGVSAGIFDPSSGNGPHLITYSYTDINGCSASCSFTITVNAAPVVTCPANSSVCIDATPFALAGASPAGGTYSGPGVTAGTFNPATAGTGTHTISYSFTNGSGCTASCSFTITVNALPVVTCPSNSAVCINATPFALGGATPAGGTYSGPGVTAGTFNPATAGTGTHTINYSFTNGSGCMASCSFTITVNALPVVTCPGNSAVCINATPFALAGATPVGGTYSGPGVTAGTFSPAAAGTGAKTITYTYTDVNGCTASCSFTITVNALPVVSCPANAAVCINATPFALTGATPVGGTYSGPGVTAGTFSPAAAGTGAKTITYTYTDLNGCTASCSFTITVNALPVVTCPANTAVCINATPFALTGATPVGGTYSGTGVTAGSFNPATAGAGSHTITYSYTDINSCSASCSFTIRVDPLPVVTCPASFSICSSAAPVALSGGTPVGGTYSGPGVSAGQFNPATAGTGAHTITYSYTNPSTGCSNSCTFTITVTSTAVVTCPANFSVCSNAAPFALTGGSPVGGTYSGTGVTAGIFNPATAGPGTHIITYSQGAACPGSCTFTITVNAAPVVTCPANFTICSNATPVTLSGGSPVGGTYSGPGVTAGVFNPATAGAGTHTISYSFTNGSGCTASCSFTITVNAAPVVTCPANFTICSTAAPVTLTGGSPAGGTYSGTGVSAGQFNPATAGTGTHTITYSYTDIGTGCSNTCSFTITVTATASVTCPANLIVCTNTTAFTLTGGSPVGGTYSGTGVTAGIFNPATAGPGTHTITYSQGAGCPGSCTFTITVQAPPVVTCPADFSICSNATPVTLTGGSPAGGTYSGTGVSGGVFNPATAGAGAHTITYTYTNPSNNCSNSCSFVITVNAAPVVTCPASFTVCSTAAAFALSGASPAGGTYSGPGVSAGNFNPALAGTGNHTITYSYTNPSNGCSNTCSFTITVTATATVTCPASFALCINAAPVTLTGGSPAGGTYSGTGVTAGVFNPATAGPGVHTITYSQGAGCPGSCTFTITVNALPVVTCPAGFAVCSNAGPVTLSGGSPAGGTYSGTGVSAGVFNPVTAGAGVHTITYTYTNPSTGCSNSCNFSITVNPAPVVSCPGNSTVCILQPAFALTGASPAGGVYSGTGVSAGMFNPATAGTGTHTITYTATGVNGCTASCSFTITVVSSRTSAPTCPASFSVCENSGPVTLTGGSPAGGTYSGTGVSSGIFNPAVAGPGVHTITYTENNFCGATCTFTITVDAAPVVSCPAGFTVCGSQTPFILTGGSPAGGTYSGPGVSGNIFNPSFANAGANTITYTYTNPANGCSNSCAFNITVNKVTASISGNATVPVNPAANSPVTITGNGGSLNYTFTYQVSVNGGAPGPVQTVTTSGSNSVILLQSNALSGTYNYQLLSVTDGNGCAGTVNSPGNITIAVVAGAPLPGPDITGSQLFSSLQLGQNTFLDEVIVIRNVGTGSTTAPVVFTATNYAAITGLSAASYPGASLTIGFTTYPLDNANWTISSTPSVLTFTSNAGVVIPPGGSRNLGVRISRAAGANGQVTHTVTITPNTGGGESPTSNNTISNTILKN